MPNDAPFSDLLNAAMQGGKKRGGRPKKNPPALLEAVRHLRTNEAWQGVLAYNEFTHCIMLRKPIPGTNRPGEFPRNLDDTGNLDTTCWLQSQGIAINSHITLEALHIVAMDAAFHPPREYLDAMRPKWDGVDRLDTWTIEHLGAADTRLNRAISAKWHIAAVARIRRPGCIMKNMPVYEGPQDMGKSTAFSNMAVNEEWFVDHIPHLASKDAQQQMQGKWIIEIAELDAILKAEASRAKAFISTRSDTFRPPYGRITKDHPRQSVFVGTINPGSTGYLSDETGNVRYWTVQCAVGWEIGREIDQAALLKVRDQLWAEAQVRYDKGEEWWLTEPELRAAQREQAEGRTNDDSRVEDLPSFVEGRKWVMMSDLLIRMGFEIKDQDKRIQTLTGTALFKLGWVRHRCRTGPVEGLATYYFPPGTIDCDAYAVRMKKECSSLDTRAGTLA